MAARTAGHPLADRTADRAAVLIAAAAVADRAGAEAVEAVVAARRAAAAGVTAAVVDGRTGRQNTGGVSFDSVPAPALLPTLRFWFGYSTSHSTGTGQSVFFPQVK